MGKLTESKIADLSVFMRKTKFNLAELFFYGETIFFQQI